MVVGDAQKRIPRDWSATPNQIEDTGSKPSLINWEVAGRQISANSQSCASPRFFNQYCHGAAEPKWWQCLLLDGDGRKKK